MHLDVICMDLGQSFTLPLRGSAIVNRTILLLFQTKVNCQASGSTSKCYILNSNTAVSGQYHIISNASIVNKYLIHVLVEIPRDIC